MASATDRLKVTSNEGGNTDYPFSGGLASGKRAGVRPFTTINYFDATGNAGVLEVYARSTYTNFNQNLFVNYNSLLGSNTVTVNTGGTGTNVLINGTVTLNAIIAAFNSEFHVAGNSVRARLPSGASGTATVTWTADGRRGHQPELHRRHGPDRHAFGRLHGRDERACADGALVGHLRRPDGHHRRARRVPALSRWQCGGRVHAGRYLAGAQRHDDRFHQDAGHDERGGTPIRLRQRGRRCGPLAACGDGHGGHGAGGGDDPAPRRRFR